MIDHFATDQRIICLFRLMSSRRGDVFVGFLRKDIWNEKKLRAYLNAHISENGENCINRCDLMSYKEPKFKGTI